MRKGKWLKTGDRPCRSKMRDHPSLEVDPSPRTSDDAGREKYHSKRHTRPRKPADNRLLISSRELGSGRWVAAAWYRSPLALDDYGMCAYSCLRAALALLEPVDVIKGYEAHVSSQVQVR